MATFISTISFTDHGATNVSDTCKRANRFKSAAKKMGVRVKDVYWTLGDVDGMVVLEAPSAEVATAALLHLAAGGEVTTSTCQAFKTAEMQEILKSMDG